MGMNKDEAINHALQLANKLQEHCKKYDLLEGIFHGVVVDGGRFQELIIKKFAQEIKEIAKQTEGKLNSPIIQPGDF